MNLCTSLLLVSSNISFLHEFNQDDNLSLSVVVDTYYFPGFSSYMRFYLLHLPLHHILFSFIAVVDYVLLSLSVKYLHHFCHFLIAQVSLSEFNISLLFFSHLCLSMLFLLGLLFSLFVPANFSILLFPGDNQITVCFY